MTDSKFAEGTREAAECRKCGSPVWIVYHGPRANHTLEPRQAELSELRTVTERLVEAAEDLMLAPLPSDLDRNPRERKEAVTNLKVALADCRAVLRKEGEGVG